MFSGLGANAVPMPVTKLESHTVDAQKSPYSHTACAGEDTARAFFAAIEQARGKP
ncbi:hypothetical protein [Paracidovorax avenae]|jgi:TRAP-type C4-dicarboxylate transport system substrate-binding protein|uniref:hypothetical protein n=1 Tax=Paracidovorax avenae TaxID=80867 RepID=UPI001865607E|nr:hypothetical protein [Paracidovorax avenae]